MYCSNCGFKIQSDDNFCKSCGKQVGKTNKLDLEEKTAKVVDVTTDDKLTIEYSNKTIRVFHKILYSLCFALLVGVVTFIVSNEVLEVSKYDKFIVEYKKDPKANYNSFTNPDDFPFQLRVGDDNFTLRKQVLQKKSIKYAITSTIIAFCVSILFKLIKIEKLKNE